MQSSSPKSKLVEKEYRKTHKVFTLVMCMQVCVAMLIGFFTGTFWFGLITALLIASVPIYLGFANPTSAISRHAVRYRNTIVGILAHAANHGHDGNALSGIRASCIFIVLSRLESNCNGNPCGRCASHWWIRFSTFGRWCDRIRRCATCILDSAYPRYIRHYRMRSVVSNGAPSEQ